MWTREHRRVKAALFTKERKLQVATSLPLCASSPTEMRVCRVESFCLLLQARLKNSAAILVKVHSHCKLRLL